MYTLFYKLIEGKEKRMNIESVGSLKDGWSRSNLSSKGLVTVIGLHNRKV